MNIYNIYWLPAPAAGSTTSVLQNGAPTSMASNYKNVLDAVTTGVATSIGATNVYAPDQGESLYNIAAQYYQSLSGKVTYVADSGGLAASVVDTNPYPASGCTNSVTPGNCLTDAQIQTEISKVMTANGWTPGINKIYVMYTSSGEGSCASGSACSYTYYCAYIPLSARRTLPWCTSICPTLIPPPAKRQDRPRPMLSGLTRRPTSRRIR